MILKTLLITAISCTLIAGPSYAQTAQDSQMKNKKPSNKSAEKNKRSSIYLQLEGIEGESTKRASGSDCNDTDPDCKKSKKTKDE